MANKRNQLKANLEILGQEVANTFHLIQVKDKYLTNEGYKTLKELGKLAITLCGHHIRGIKS